MSAFNTSSDFIRQRSFEIAFAVFRVAALIQRSHFRNDFERAAVDLYVNEKKEAIGRLERLVRLAEAVGEINQVNAAVLYRELGNLDAAIRQAAETRAVESEANIEKIFSKPPMVIENHSISGNGYNGNGNGINSAIRQSALLDKIRKSGNIAMKDFIAAFPEVSERTLRYDLQKLGEQGLIERVGNGGPGSYYRPVGLLVRQEQSSQ